MFDSAFRCEARPPSSRPQQRRQRAKSKRVRVGAEHKVERVEEAFSVVSAGTKNRVRKLSTRADFAELYPSIDDGFFPLSLFEKRRPEQTQERAPVSELIGTSVVSRPTSRAKERTHPGTLQEKEHTHEAVGSVTDLLSTRPLSKKKQPSEGKECFNKEETATRLRQGPSLAQCTDDDMFWTYTPNVATQKKRCDGVMHEPWVLRPFWSDSLAAARKPPKTRQKVDACQDQATLPQERGSIPTPPACNADAVHLRKSQQPQISTKSVEEDAVFVPPRISVRVSVVATTTTPRGRRQ